MKGSDGCCYQDGLPAADFDEEVLVTPLEVVVGEFPFVRYDLAKALWNVNMKWN